jgi:DNA mismatch repair ATPase MutS
MNKKKDKMIALLAFAIILIIMVIDIGVTWGKNKSSAYYLIILAAIPFAALGIFAYRKIRYYKTFEKVRYGWGKEVKRKRDFKSIKGLFNYIDKDSFYIDDQTWDDLDMNIVYSKVDRTHTSPGEQALYAMLRTPELSYEKLDKRKKVMDIFQNDSNLREEIGAILFNIGKQRKNYITSLLWEDLPQKTILKPLFNIAAILAYGSIASIVFFGKTAILTFVLPVFTMNLFTHYKIKEKIEGQLLSIRYLSSVIRGANKISRYDDLEIKEYTEELKKLAHICRSIPKKSGLILPESTDVLFEYAKIFSLKEVRSFYAVLDEIRKNADSLRRLYILLGEVDALLSVASFRNGLKHYVEPEFIEGGCSMKVENIFHPLLENPVANSIEINDEGIIITGSNMSGKSTFLRTIGVNILFAQTICTCLAESYLASFFRIMTSISRADNIMGGKSYYLAEAEALLRIVNASGEKIPCFCIIDEVFRGTNSVERICASSEILNYLVNRNSIVIIATHDLELAEMLKENYKCYYFSEKVGQEGLNFDYTIKKGISNTRNAVKLMDYIGYPKSIIDGTNNRINKFIEDKK